MKILMLTWEYPPRIVGGIARVVHDLSKRLIKLIKMEKCQNLKMIKGLMYTE